LISTFAVTIPPRLALSELFARMNAPLAYTPAELAAINAPLAYIDEEFATCDGVFAAMNAALAVSRAY
jgi:hypothetical protein